MRAVEILQDLKARGFALALAGQGIKVTPASSLTEADVEAIRAHKWELRTEIRRTQYYVDPADPIVVTRVGGDRFIDDLVQAGQLQVSTQAGQHMPVQKWRLPGPVANPPIRKATTPPLACLAGIAIDGMTPAEHWEAIGGTPVVGALSFSAELSLRMAVIMSARDDPRSRAAGERDYTRLWRTFTTGEMA